MSVGLVTNDSKHVSYLLGLALDRFQIDIVVRGGTVADAVTRLESASVDIWLARMAGKEAEQWRTLLPGRDEPSQPGPLVAVCEGTEPQVADALANGASAVVLPDDSVFDTAAAMHAAASCDLFISPRVLRRMDRRLADVLTAGLPRTDLITEREECILTLMSEGMSNAAIGSSLHISPATVATHVGNILRKLEARNRTEAVTTALELSLITRPARRHALASR
nr:response regulator transcription factor [Streptomyces scabichelini]